ncbi:oxaloacetate decarboxylase subunit alpha [Ihubacter sp. mB4P-1]
MNKMSEKKLKITETVLRDAHQSLIATRMRTEDMIPILEKMDRIGYYSIECWGGATFDACLRFLDEDPWSRLRTLRAKIKDTKLQMLLRGQNLLGYRHYADDVVEYFVQKSVAGGIDILRIFDAFNDLRNVETAVNAAKKEGAEVQLAMAYTTGEAYTLDYWTKLAADMESMGADSICIKDMAGILVPEEASRLITALKDTVKIPLQLHSHCTSGVAPITYVKGVEAGCDIIDTAISPFAMGTSQPATEVMVETFSGTPFDTGLDQELLSEIADYFRPQRDQAIATGLMDPKVLGVDVKTLLYQVPGGMLSNLVSQLKDQNASDRFYEVLAEIPKVRQDLGEPPLVTPSSQIVGTQAVLNVLMGERYKVMSQETKAILHGDYGKTVKPFNPQVQHLAIGNDTPVTCRPADLLAPELESLREEVKLYSQKDEDVLSYALFPKVAVDFFKNRDAKANKIDPGVYDLANKAYPV